jgi:hypothetical protein
MSFYVLTLSHISGSHWMPSTDQFWCLWWTVLLHVSSLPEFQTAVSVGFLQLQKQIRVAGPHIWRIKENVLELSIATVPEDLSLVLTPSSVCCTAQVLEHLQWNDDAFLALLDIGHSPKTFSNTLHSQCSPWRLHGGGWHQCYYDQWSASLWPSLIPGEVSSVKESLDGTIC